MLDPNSDMYNAVHTHDNKLLALNWLWTWVKDHEVFRVRKGELTLFLETVKTENGLVNQGGWLDWGKLRKYIGFYATGRDRERDLRCKFVKWRKPSVHFKIGLNAKQMWYITWRMKMKRRIYQRRRSALLTREAEFPEFGASSNSQVTFLRLYWKHWLTILYSIRICWDPGLQVLSSDRTTSWNGLFSLRSLWSNVGGGSLHVPLVTKFLPQNQHHMKVIKLLPNLCLCGPQAHKRIIVQLWVLVIYIRIVRSYSTFRLLYCGALNKRTNA